MSMFDELAKKKELTGAAQPAVEKPFDPAIGEETHKALEPQPDATESPSIVKPVKIKSTDKKKGVAGRKKIHNDNSGTGIMMRVYIEESEAKQAMIKYMAKTGEVVSLPQFVTIATKQLMKKLEGN